MRAVSHLYDRTVPQWLAPIMPSTPFHFALFSRDDDLHVASHLSSQVREELSQYRIVVCPTCRSCIIRIHPPAPKVAVVNERLHSRVACYDLLNLKYRTI